jgi:hypothetical protein
MPLDITLGGVGAARRAAAPAIAAAIAILVALAMAAPVAGGIPAPRDRFVDDDGLAGAGGCDGQNQVPKRIQRAINNSNDGDTILVCPGDYRSFTVEDPNNLMVRSFTPWTARIIEKADADEGALIRVEGVDNTTIQWFTVLAQTQGCVEGGLFALIDAGHADGVQIRANHLGVIGTDTLGDCGYDTGIRVEESDGWVVAYNRIVDFKFVGIQLENAPFVLDEDTKGGNIHGNTMRYFHESEAVQNPDDAGLGIAVFRAEKLKIARNWFRSLPSGGETTPQMNTGVSVSDPGFGTDMKIRDNRLFYVRCGICLGAFKGSLISGNRVRFSRTTGISLFNVNGTLIEHNAIHDGLGNGIVLQDGPFDSGASGNTIQNNNFTGNDGTDCVDETIDPPDNTWDADTNLGDDANQEGLCTPGVVDTIN